MNGKQYVDERVANDAETYQKTNTGRTPVNATARPERARVSADAEAFQPTDAEVVGDLNVSPVIDGQELEVRGAGDLAAGGVEPDAEDRTPGVAGL